MCTGRYRRFPQRPHLLQPPAPCPDPPSLRAAASHAQELGLPGCSGRPRSACSFVQRLVGRNSSLQLNKAGGTAPVPRNF